MKPHISALLSAVTEFNIAVIEANYSFAAVKLASDAFRAKLDKLGIAELFSWEV